MLVGHSLRRLIREKAFELPVVMPTSTITAVARLTAVGGPLLLDC